LWLLLTECLILFSYLIKSLFENKERLGKKALNDQELYREGY